MKRNIVESYSIEEAFRALNKASNKLIHEMLTEFEDELWPEESQKRSAEDIQKECAKYRSLFKVTSNSTDELIKEIVTTNASRAMFEFEGAKEAYDMGDLGIIVLTKKNTFTYFRMDNEFTKSMGKAIFLKKRTFREHLNALGYSDADYEHMKNIVISKISGASQIISKEERKHASITARKARMQAAIQSRPPVSDPYKLIFKSVVFDDLSNEIAANTKADGSVDMYTAVKNVSQKLGLIADADVSTKRVLMQLLKELGEEIISEKTAANEV